MNISNLKISKNFSTFFFILFFIFGFSKIKDYGITYDELEYRQQGFVMLKHIADKTFPNLTKKIIKEKKLDYPSIQNYLGNIKNNYKTHHTLFAGLEFLFFKDSPKKVIYLFRHYMNFLMSSIMIIFFYKLLRLNFNRSISLLGSTLFFFNPKIFPDFIYNPNDIWFTFFLTICLYFGLYFIKKKKIKYFYLLPIFISLALSTRIIGLYYYFIFLFIWILNINLENRNIDTKVIYSLLLQLVILIFSLYILTPQLWENPLTAFNEIFLGQIKFNGIDPQIMFLGEITSASNVSRYYLIVWILISTPIVILFFFLIGLCAIFYNYYKTKFLNLYLFTMLIYLFAPLIAIQIFKPVIYNGWRHFYFLYPAIIYVSIYGLDFICKIKLLKKIKEVSFLLIFLNFAYLINWSIQNHPHQYVFFNILSKKNSYKFENDYWGASDLSAIKFILQNDKKKIITITGLGNTRVDFTLNLLSNDELNRLKVVKVSENNFNDDIDYYISRFNDGLNVQKYLENGFKVYNSVKVDDKSINTTFTYKKYK